ncbi:hypothetical protein EV182_005076 [Spiromyces aspiralis]|uniref:Uncharacterized protein n=1 Tax=Spiromyces aspiralis TaxID=68401 RepID=A0ACC1HBI8_9FUNG|nr:hypothetical protein EV182_005076 [Spiromyces aspiralis]
MVNNRIDPTIACTRIKSNNLPTKQGISLLEVKHQTLLEYITDLTFISLLKLNGRSIDSHPVVKRLIENRVVLEKIKPLEQRLKYQIDKLLRAATLENDDGDTKEQGSGGTQITRQGMVDADVDPSAFKPNPSLMVTKEQDGSGAEQESGDEEDEGKGAGGEDGVYKAPKMVPVPYEEDASLKARREKAEQRIAEKAARSRLVQDLMSEYDNRPEVITASGNTGGVGTLDGRAEREVSERRTFEEDNFTRLSLNRKQKRKLKQGFKRLDDDFSSLNDFVGLSGLSKLDKESTATRRDLLKRARTHKANAVGAGDSKGDDGDMNYDQQKVKRMRQGKFQNLKRWKSKPKE